MAQDLREELAHFEDGDVFADAGAGAAAELGCVREAWGMMEELGGKSAKAEKGWGQKTHGKESPIHQPGLLGRGIKPSFRSKQGRVVAVYILIQMHDWGFDRDDGPAGESDAADGCSFRGNVAFEGEAYAGV